MDSTIKHPILVQLTDKSTNQSDIDDWDHHDIEAQAQLTLTLKNESLSSILHAISAANVWDKLNHCYEGKDQNTIAYLIKEIFYFPFVLFCFI